MAIDLVTATEVVFDQGSLATAMRATMSLVPAFVSAEGFSTNDTRRLKVLLPRHVGVALDVAALETDIGQLLGLDRYETITWRLVKNDTGDPGIMVTGRVKPYAPPFVMLGLNLENTTSTDLPHHGHGPVSRLRRPHDVACGLQRRHEHRDPQRFARRGVLRPDRGGFGTSFDETALPTYQFILGSPLRLGAHRSGELRASNDYIATGGYLRQLGRLPDFFGGPVFAGGWLENGDAFEGWDTATLRTNASVALIMDTLIGPVMVAGSAGFDGRWRSYIAVGRIFR